MTQNLWDAVGYARGGGQYVDMNSIRGQKVWIPDFLRRIAQVNTDVGYGRLKTRKPNWRRYFTGYRQPNMKVPKGMYVADVTGNSKLDEWNKEMQRIYGNGNKFLNPYRQKLDEAYKLQVTPATRHYRGNQLISQTQGLSEAQKQARIRQLEKQANTGAGRRIRMQNLSNAVKQGEKLQKILEQMNNSRVVANVPVHVRF